MCIFADDLSMKNLIKIPVINRISKVIYYGCYRGSIYVRNQLAFYRTQRNI